MKTLLYIIFIALTGTAYAQEEISDAQFKALAKDMCGCVNKKSSKISKNMKEAIILAGSHPESMESIIQEQVMKDPEKGMKDVEAMMTLSEEIGKCSEPLEKKYKDLYSSEDPEIVQQKLLEIMGTEKECAFTHALMLIGINSPGEEAPEYYDEEYYDEEE